MFRQWKSNLASGEIWFALPRQTNRGRLKEDLCPHIASDFSPCCYFSEPLGGLGQAVTKGDDPIVLVQAVHT